MNETALCRAAANGSASPRALSSLVPVNCSAPATVAEEPFFTSHPEFVVEFSKLLYGLVCLVGLCGNSLVIYVVLRFSKMQTVTNMYIFNLALADEMFLVGLPFFIATMVFKYWPFGAAMCKVYMTTTSINQFTSSLLLTVMSADRYVAVCHPISSPRYRTPFIAKFVCLTAWTVSALLMVPVYMYASVVDAGTVKSCTIVWPESGMMNGQAAFTLYSFTLGFAIPLLLILLFYVLVILRLSRVGPRSRHRAKHRKVTYLVLTVITVYVICWLPYWAGQLYISCLGAAQATAFTVTVFLLSQLLSYANSAVNPILYAFLSDNFKKSFAKAFSCAAVAAAHGSGRGREQPQEDSMFPRSSAAPGGGGTGNTQTGASKCGDDDGSSRRSSEGGGGGGRRRRRRRRRLLSAGPCCSERPTSTTTAGAAAMLLNEPSTNNTVAGARNANGAGQGASGAGSILLEQGEQGAEHLLLGPLVDVPH
ncbi:somatostatin receptor type 2-like [Dermacentor andersoni]|uniref:somatostatin receptor type 2-like n=1 Tax=Dermacentor andersoni TaxID=34620 RepID=UPI002155BCF4|nr:somatostatin receptor type 2-like [Dermacentor andersoni]